MRIIIYVVFFLAYVAKCIFYAQVVHLGVPPDEKAHLSYISYLKETKSFFPEYGKMREQHIAEWTKRSNHLGHPPYYYHLLGLFVSERKGEIWQSYPTLRMVNVALSSLAVFCMLLLGARFFWRLPEHILYASFVTSFPMLGFLGGAINNDNLAILGGALGLLGLFLFREKKYFLFGVLLAGVGFGICALSKLTALLLVGLTIGGVFFAFLVQKRERRKHLFFRFLLTSPLYLLPLSHYAYSFYSFGALIPTDGIENIQKDFAMSGGKSVELSLSQYVKYFIARFEKTATGIHGHVAVEKGNFLGVGYVCFLVFGLLQFLFLRKTKKDSALLVSRIGLIAIGIVLCLQFQRAYSGYLEANFLGGVQARYYLPLLPAVAVLGISGISRFLPCSKSFWVCTFFSFYFILCDLPYLFYRSSLEPGGLRGFFPPLGGL